MVRPDAPEWSSHRAREIAIEAHEGQEDKAGRPYLGHVERVSRYACNVALLVGLDGPDADLVHEAAWLHDVIEDTGLDRDDLRARGVPARVLEIVEVMSRPDGEDYESYFHRVAADPLARLVKIADMADNLDPDRLALLDGAAQARLRKKYTAHWLTLTRPVFTG